MEIGLKWVHVARYELILKLDGALWLRIIFKPLLTPKGAIQMPNKSQQSLKVRAKPAKLLQKPCAAGLECSAAATHPLCCYKSPVHCCSARPSLLPQTG